jgi:hypothetical protein
MIWAALAPAWIKRALAWAVAGLVVFAGVLGLAKRDARRGVALDAARDAVKQHEVRNDIEAGIDSGADPKQRLRSKWTR